MPRPRDVGDARWFDGDPRLFRRAWVYVYAHVRAVFDPLTQYQRVVRVNPAFARTYASARMGGGCDLTHARTALHRGV